MEEVTTHPVQPPGDPLGPAAGTRVSNHTPVPTSCSRQGPARRHVPGGGTGGGRKPGRWEGEVPGAAGGPSHDSELPSNAAQLFLALEGLCAMLHLQFYHHLP